MIPATAILLGFGVFLTFQDSLVLQAVGIAVMGVAAVLLLELAKARSGSDEGI
jgi:multisubunit Na+/H+ antiporter MnhC subunit